MAGQLAQAASPGQGKIMQDRRLFSEAAARNRDPILDVLKSILPPKGRVLEIASGSGEHIVHFASALRALTFQPTDPSAEAHDSIAAWVETAGVSNVLPPLQLDATKVPWPVEKADAIICINMIHISPWRATERLIDGARSILPEGAPLYLYGPFKRDGRDTSSSNAQFDESLRARNPEWGVRNLEAVIARAERAGFAKPDVFEMPANNLSLAFYRQR